jgi:pimeloyl-ACP methyl ester carboxylesterase
MRRLAIASLVVLAGCGGSDAPPQPVASATPSAEQTAAQRSAATPRPRLTDERRCGPATCWTLRVPLDRTRKGGETLSLRVGIEGERGPVFVILSGGPGQPGVPFLDRARQWLGPVAAKLRLVAIDQRGTGANALRCPALQREMGASDLTPPTPGAVTGCARELGENRRFYGTADTVADIEALRIALDADKLTLDGTSYGTYTAQRYALAHPERVRGLVLDSVVPVENVSLLSEVPMKATRRILGEQATKDVAEVVRTQHNGPELLDLLTLLSVGAPRGNGAQGAIAQAAKGNDGPLKALQSGVARVMEGYTAPRLSQGLHASTLCADAPAPWGDASAPLQGREQALDEAAAKLREEDLYPYDRETATGNGIALQCLHWPPVDIPDPQGPAPLPDVPTVLLAGDKDLSTPMEWAQRTAERNPHAELIVVEGAGHGVQNQGDPEALEAVRRLASPG